MTDPTEEDDLSSAVALMRLRMPSADELWEKFHQLMASHVADRVADHDGHEVYEDESGHRCEILFDPEKWSNSFARPAARAYLSGEHQPEEPVHYGWPAVTDDLRYVVWMGYPYMDLYDDLLVGLLEPGGEAWLEPPES